MKVLKRIDTGALGAFTHSLVILLIPYLVAPWTKVHLMPLIPFVATDCTKILVVCPVAPSRGSNPPRTGSAHKSSSASSSVSNEHLHWLTFPLEVHPRHEVAFPLQTPQKSAPVAEENFTYATDIST